jgi:hypothetical protein
MANVSAIDPYSLTVMDAQPATTIVSGYQNSAYGTENFVRPC